MAKPRKAIHTNALEFRRKLSEVEEMYLDHIKDAVSVGFEAAQELATQLRMEIDALRSRIAMLEKKNGLTPEE
jgi:BMFP domain-containing protein YqiC